MGGSLLLPALLVTKSSLRSSGDRCIIVGARDFSPDAWGAGHLLPYEGLFALPLLYRKRNPACGCRADGSIIATITDFVVTSGDVQTQSSIEVFPS
ncbi:MAG: hypothetical protein IKK73_02190, partial [Akkermansia sp.]|nr:hypothetical protein [Akkermansia sp.]